MKPTILQPHPLCRLLQHAMQLRWGFALWCFLFVSVVTDIIAPPLTILGFQHNTLYVYTISPVLVSPMLWLPCLFTEIRHLLMHLYEPGCIPRTQRSPPFSIVHACSWNMVWSTIRQVHEQSYYIVHHVRRKEEGKEGRKKWTNTNNLQQPQRLRKKYTCVHTPSFSSLENYSVPSS